MGVSAAKTLSCLAAPDSGAVLLEDRDGAVIISPALQGRIFCTVGDELIHQLDTALLAAPFDTEFNNIGGINVALGGADSQQIGARVAHALRLPVAHIDHHSSW